MSITQDIQKLTDNSYLLSLNISSMADPSCIRVALTIQILRIDEVKKFELEAADYNSPYNNPHQNVCLDLTNYTYYPDGFYELEIWCTPRTIEESIAPLLYARDVLETILGEEYDLTTPD